MSAYPDKSTDASRPRPSDTKAQDLTGSSEGGTDMDAGGAEGEEEGSVPSEGEDRHVKEDQKPTSR